MSNYASIAKDTATIAAALGVVGAFCAGIWHKSKGRIQTSFKDSIRSAVSAELAPQLSVIGAQLTNGETRFAAQDQSQTSLGQMVTDMREHVIEVKENQAQVRENQLVVAANQESVAKVQAKIASRLDNSERMIVDLTAKVDQSLTNHNVLLERTDMTDGAIVVMAEEISEISHETHVNSGESIKDVINEVKKASDQSRLDTTQWRLEISERQFDQFAQISKEINSLRSSIVPILEERTRKGDASQRASALGQVSKEKIQPAPKDSEGTSG